MYLNSGGERGIRSPGPVTVNGFQDRRIRPLCHLSAAKLRIEAFQPKSYYGIGPSLALKTNLIMILEESKLMILKKVKSGNGNTLIYHGQEYINYSDKCRGQ